MIVFEPIPVKKGSLASRFTQIVKDLKIPLSKVELVGGQPVIDNNPDYTLDLSKPMIMSTWLGFTHCFDNMLTELEKTYKRILVRVSDDVFKFDVDADSKAFFINNFMEVISRHTAVNAIDLFNSNLVDNQSLGNLIQELPKRAIYKLLIPEHISPQAVVNMCQLLSGRTIRMLDLSNIPLSGAPFLEVKKLIDESKTCLQLNMNKCQLDDNDMSGLCDSLAKLNINSVEISENQFSTAGLIAFANKLPETKVRSVIAHDNLVNNKGVRAAFLVAFKAAPITDYFNVRWAYPHTQKDETFEEKRKGLSQSFDEGRMCAEIERKHPVLPKGVFTMHGSSYLLAMCANKAFLRGYLAYKRVALQKDDCPNQQAQTLKKISSKK